MQWNPCSAFKLQASIGEDSIRDQFLFRINLALGSGLLRFRQHCAGERLQPRTGQQQRWRAGD